MSDKGKKHVCPKCKIDMEGSHYDAMARRLTIICTKCGYKKASK